MLKLDPHMSIDIATPCAHVHQRHQLNVKVRLAGVFVAITGPAMYHQTVAILVRGVIEGLNMTVWPLKISFKAD
jgi:hypothetical protein